METREKNRRERLHKQLFDEFEKWKPLFMDVRDYVNPWLGFFEGENPSDGKRRDDKIIRSTVVKYAHIFAAGLQWGVTSPTRPWLRMAVPDDSAMQQDEVRYWLDAVKTQTLDVMAQSNFYSANHQGFLEMGTFGTSAMLIDEDAEDVIYCRTFTCGEYALGVNHKGNPNAFARLIKMTPSQIVDKFGFDNCPQTVKNQYQNGNDSQFIDVKHLIYPNEKHEEGKIGTSTMRFVDWYWCGGQKEDEYLRKGGYNEFPVMVDRGQTCGANVYGTGPGIWALGDAKQLQLLATDICIATELGIKPPVQAPMDVLKNGGINILPAGANYYNPAGGSDGAIKPVFQVALNIEHARVMAAEVEDAIKEHFSVKVFQLLSEMEHGTRTAREVIELSSEKMSQMGPLLERIQEYLSLVVERVFNICLRRGMYPPPPETIAGMPIKIEYVSVLSQAQQQYIITPIVDTVNNAVLMATNSQNMAILDKIDFDEVVDQIGSANGVPPSIIVSDEKVAQIRQVRAQQQAQAQQAQTLMDTTVGAKNLSQASLDGNNALSKVMNGLQLQ